MVQNTKGEQITPRNERTRNRRAPEVPFIAGCCHCTRKNKRFRALALPQNKAHATIMQPSQCVLQHHLGATLPSSPRPFVITMRFAASRGTSLVMWCKVSRPPSWIYCYLMQSLTPPLHECIVMWWLWCKVSPPLHECIVMWCNASHPPHECIAMWCKVSHFPSWMYCYVMQSLTHAFMNVLLRDAKSHTPFHECIVMWCKVSHPLHECIVMWCKVWHPPSWMYCCVMQSLTILFVRKSEDCIPTSFDYTMYVSRKENRKFRLEHRGERTTSKGSQESGNIMAPWCAQ